MLNTVDRNHAAPPPVDPGICEFGSFADKRYELSKSVESGALTPELWAVKCQQLAEQSSEKEACRYDPFADRMTHWRRLVDEGKASKEGAEMDCRNYVKQLTSIISQVRKSQKTPPSCRDLLGRGASNL